MSNFFIYSSFLLFHFFFFYFPRASNFSNSANALTSETSDDQRSTDGEKVFLLLGKRESWNLSFLHNAPTHPNFNNKNLSNIFFLLKEKAKNPFVRFQASSYFQTLFFSNWKTLFFCNIRKFSSSSGNNLFDALICKEKGNLDHRSIKKKNSTNWFSLSLIFINCHRKFKLYCMFATLHNVANPHLGKFFFSSFHDTAENNFFNFNAPEFVRLEINEFLLHR